MREHIEKSDPEFLRFFESLYDIQPLDDTEPWFTEAAQDRWNNSVNHSLWSAFENYMGNPNTTEMLELSTSVTEGMPSDGIRDHMYYYWKDHFGIIDKLSAHIKEWVETINTDNIIPKRKKLISSSDIFFTFNYTDVLEKVYRINNVLHVHGGVSSICDIDPIMGHCNKIDIKKHRKWAAEADDEFQEAEASIQDAVADYLEKIFKDTDKQINYHKIFFDKLSAVNHVVSIGWSGGDVDFPYLREIERNVSSNTQWNVYWHSESDFRALENVFEKIERFDKRLLKFEQSDKFWDVL